MRALPEEARGPGVTGKDDQARGVGDQRWRCHQDQQRRGQGRPTPDSRGAAPAPIEGRPYERGEQEKEPSQRGLRPASQHARDCEAQCREDRLLGARDRERVAAELRDEAQRDHRPQRQEAEVTDGGRLGVLRVRRPERDGQDRDPEEQRNQQSGPHRSPHAEEAAVARASPGALQPRWRHVRHRHHLGVGRVDQHATRCERGSPPTRRASGCRCRPSECADGVPRRFVGSHSINRSRCRPHAPAVRWPGRANRADSVTRSQEPGPVSRSSRKW
jgi:hypothetical protein